MDGKDFVGPRSAEPLCNDTDRTNDVLRITVVDHHYSYHEYAIRTKSTPCSFYGIARRPRPYVCPGPLWQADACSTLTLSTGGSTHLEHVVANTIRREPRRTKRFVLSHNIICHSRVGVNLPWFGRVLGLLS